MITGFFKQNKRKSVILTFTNSTQWTVPLRVKNVEVFAVGGGGAGSPSYNITFGNGGNGGQVMYDVFNVAPGELIDITIGSGGISDIFPEMCTNGGASMFGTYLTALGGVKGVYNTTGDQPFIENMARGGFIVDDSAVTGYGKAGEDGVECPFLSTGDKYGAGGGNGIREYNVTHFGVGGETGGGDGGIGDGSTGSFFGAGGGSAAWTWPNYTRHVGGLGHNGIVIVRCNF